MSQGRFTWKLFSQQVINEARELGYALPGICFVLVIWQLAYAYPGIVGIRVPWHLLCIFILAVGVRVSWHLSCTSVELRVSGHLPMIGVTKMQATCESAHIHHPARDPPYTIFYCEPAHFEALEASCMFVEADGNSFRTTCHPCASKHLHFQAEVQSNLLKMIYYPLLLNIYFLDPW